MHTPDAIQVYETTILPRFGIAEAQIEWGQEKRLGPDEVAIWFNEQQKRYILIWEDYVGLGSSSKYIKAELDLDDDQYRFVQPEHEGENSPSTSYEGDGSYKEFVTGAFTLLQLV